LILEILEDEGPMSTCEIYDFVCKVNYHGCTMNQLGNVLSRAKEIERVGRVNKSILGDRRRAIIWGLKN
jgi:hypothetical protein